MRTLLTILMTGSWTARAFILLGLALLIGVLPGLGLSVVIPLLHVLIVFAVLALVFRLLIGKS